MSLTDTGWLPGVTRIESPNQSARDDDVDVSLLVVHNISLPPGQFGTGCIQAFFQNALDPTQHPYFEQINDLHVSAHLLIERDGQTYQFVPFHRRAWHAGRSVFNGVEECNDYSIGIELEGTDDCAYTEAQYQGLAELAVVLMEAYPCINIDRIVGHSDIAPGRKTDPGACFDWGKLRFLIASAAS